MRMAKMPLDERGIIRQSHYGEGRQAWDDILDKGWGPAFAAGNIVKYLRRDKEAAHSFESARWYYARLLEMASGDIYPSRYGWMRRFFHRVEAKNSLFHLGTLLYRNELSSLLPD